MRSQLAKAGMTIADVNGKCAEMTRDHVVMHGIILYFCPTIYPTIITDQEENSCLIK